MLYPPLRCDRVEVLPAVVHLAITRRSKCLSAARSTTVWTVVKPRPPDEQTSISAESSNSPTRRGRIFRVEPGLQRGAHSHVLVGSSAGAPSTDAGKLRRSLSPGRYSTKGDAGITKPVIERLRFERARGRLVGEHNIESVRLEVTHEWTYFSLPANHMNRGFRAKRSSKNLKRD